MAQYDNRQQDERRQTLNYYAGYELASSIYTIEVLNVKVHVFVLLIFATLLPDCSQNQTAVSDTLRLLSDF
jgi:hypothetical protein